MNMNFRSTVLAAALVLVTRSLSVYSSEPSLTDRFAKPPAESRIIKIIHNWPDEAREQDDLIRRLSHQGFGGGVCNVSFDDYLESGVKWQSFRHAVTEARKAGWTLWLYDERGYPSGNAGGLVLRGHEEWEASGLLVASTETDGASVSLRVPPGKLLFAAAFPVRDGRIKPETKVDLAGLLRDGPLQCRGPLVHRAVARERGRAGGEERGHERDLGPYPALPAGRRQSAGAGCQRGGDTRHLQSPEFSLSAPAARSL